MGRGEYFGEMALLSDRTRNATVRACTAIDVLIISKPDFNKLRQSHPAFESVFSELAERDTARVCTPPRSGSHPHTANGDDREDRKYDRCREPDCH